MEELLLCFSPLTGYRLTCGLASLLSLEGLQVGYYEYVGQARVPELRGERVDGILEREGGNEIIVLK